MPGSGGRPHLAIPGPSIMPDRVLRAMHRASPNIYAGELPDMMPGVIEDLCKVARTDGQAAIYISNGHGVWEAALANTVAPGETVLALVTGRFGQGWAEVAEARGIAVETLDFGKQAAADPARVEELLRADKGHKIKAVLATHVDTSTSILNDIAGLRSALDAAGHPALLMADCIASLACDRFEMDAWGVDVMIAASQKGLMTPPGLGLVFFSAKAAEARRGLPRVAKYWDWGPRAEPELFYQYFGGTAPTHHIYGLREALDMLLEEGLEAVWARHEWLAQAVWAACGVWGADGPLRMNVADVANRSRAVTSLSLRAPDGRRLREWLEAETGVTLGIGLGMNTEDDPKAEGFFRIGHMGHLNAHGLLGVLGAIESGLLALDIPHGLGAVGMAARSLAKPAAGAAS
ncbi:pyridoxal-phosphate-dependent aminotransferase family protein [Roseovarius aestuariivivens]|uniref:pyridoxal-phosphate-dependent aminotransferase family protein n=1 Tax=Roseovarius aestuariivivens TaxID=1888910 RepID=UPI0010803040|nr:aminotransferase class V-fold PLP-dependent enzyme [Roseovarius aestuariivivens]